MNLSEKYENHPIPLKSPGNYTYKAKSIKKLAVEPYVPIKEMYVWIFQVEKKLRAKHKKGNSQIKPSM